jgi:hypothetical protein
MLDCCKQEYNLSRIIDDYSSVTQIARQCMVCGTRYAVETIAPPILNARPGGEQDISQQVW